MSPSFIDFRPSLGQAERGFSFMRNGPLDMRFGSAGQSAADIVNSWSADELERIFREYGEERYARSLAARIVEARSSMEFISGSPALIMIGDAVLASPDRDMSSVSWAKKKLVQCLDHSRIRL